MLGGKLYNIFAKGDEKLDLKKSNLGVKCMIFN
jgi:hypothetical protein